MAQRSGMDMSKVSTGEKIVLGAAAVYFIWAFLPVWYKADLGGDGKSGFQGVVVLAWLLAIVAIVEIVLRTMTSLKIDLPVRPGLLHLGVAGLALLFTLLALVSAPAFYGVSWGVFVAILVAIAWAYGAYMIYSEPETMPTSPSTDRQGGYTT
jgi:hypothetical protein